MCRILEIIIKWHDRSNCGHGISDSQFIFFFTSWTGLIARAHLFFFYGDLIIKETRCRRVVENLFSCPRIYYSYGTLIVSQYHNTAEFIFKRRDVQIARGDSQRMPYS